MPSRRRPVARFWVAIAAVLVATGCVSAVAGEASLDPAASSSIDATATATPSSSPDPGSLNPTAITVPSGGPAGSSASAGPTAPTAPSTGAPAPTAAADGSAGSPGIGDPYYPLAGNGGYQVDSYDVTVTYNPASNDLQGSANITGSVTATDKLGQFDLDLQPTMKVSAVQVNGAAATFSQRQAELVISPATGLTPGTKLTVVVSYAGQPAAVAGGTSVESTGGGWFRTDSGGAVAIGEPTSASAWYPVNEHPADTATWRVTATVPKPWLVMSNGIQQTTGLPTAPDGWTVTRWAETKPIASYLTTIYIDKFTLVTGKLPEGTPIVSALGPSAPADNRDLNAQTPAIIAMLTKHFGAYPFAAVGGIFSGQRVRFALETATRPVYANWVDLSTVVHELAHQWYGDDVTIERWADICLNECFASYAEWLWLQDVDGQDLDQYWKEQMAAHPEPGYWRDPLVDMGAGNEFDAVYRRGPLALHALRKEMGEKPFATLLSGWIKDYGGKNASFDDWEAYVNKVAGRDLTGFIKAWFRDTGIPPEKYLHPGGL